MEDIRADALQVFDERLHFTGKLQPAHILHQVGPVSEYRPFKWQPSEESELVEHARSCVDAGESVLIYAPAITTDAYWDFKRETFMTLVDLFKIDYAALRPISTIETAFCCFPNDQAETIYIRMPSSIVVWTFDQLSRTTRGLVITCGTETYEMNETHDLSASILRLSHRATLLSEPLGLLWHCYVQGLRKSKKMNDRCYDVLSAVEDSTGFGTDVRPKVLDNTALYVEWLRNVAESASVLTEARSKCCLLSSVHEALARRDVAGQPILKDQVALGVTKAQLDHETNKIDVLMNRTQNQISVLFSLIARADARVSIELTETSKALTEANLAVAREAKEDSGAMKTISIMTMLFLPGTYFAALFSMPTLQWSEASSVVRERFWIYWAFTIPTTCCVFLVWAASTKLRILRESAQAQWGKGRILGQV